MHTLEALAGRHRVEQTVGHQRQYVLIEQMIDQARAAFALRAALGQVIDEVLAPAEFQLTTAQTSPRRPSLISISSRSTGPPTG